jgi:hypothetical protein
MKVFWKTAASELFDTASNWNPGVPGAMDRALLSATGGAYTVTVRDNRTVLGVSTSADAILDITNNTTFQASEGTAIGANLGTIIVENGSTFAFGGALNNPGTIELGIGSAAYYHMLGDTTLKGGGHFYLSDATNNVLWGIGTLTNVDNLIYGAGFLEPNIVNQSGGTIEALSGLNKLVLSFNNITNTGKLFGAGAAGLDLDHSVVNNVGGTIVAGAGAFV